MELSQKWAKNKEKLPKSNYPMFASEEEEKKDKKKAFAEENDDEDCKTYFQKVGKDIRLSHMPSIDLKKKQEREAIIFALEDPKKASRKYTLNKQKKKRIILKKRDNSKPSKFKWELKFAQDDDNVKTDVINQNLVHKPKKINLIPIVRTTTEPPEKKPDYLKEILNQREEKKNRAKSSKGKQNKSTEMFESNKNSKKWEIEINKKGNIIDNINDIEEKAKNIEKEANLKEKQLQLNGGFENNVELGKKVSSLLIDSIEAKINILKKMNMKA